MHALKKISSSCMHTHNPPSYCTRQPPTHTYIYLSTSLSLPLARSLSLSLSLSLSTCHDGTGCGALWIGGSIRSRWPGDRRLSVVHDIWINDARVACVATATAWEDVLPTAAWCCLEVALVLRTRLRVRVDETRLELHRQNILLCQINF
jgi:hypothetical protein